MNTININHSCANGKLNELIKLQKQGYKFKYNKYAIIWAACYGHIHTLEWFKNSGYEFKCDKNAINWPLKWKKIKILKWFKNNNYKTKLNYIKQYKN
jgi:hypothetical protein